MTSPPTIAVTHYPEGAGHATRMLSIANALQKREATVEFAGGGAGSEFVALNGYEEFEPTIVDYIDTFQGDSLRSVLAKSVPATAARVTEYVEWLRDLEPDALVTDDMFAAIAATRFDIPLYVLKHDVPALYQNRLERASASFHTSFQLLVAREFFYPTVWPKSDTDPPGVTHVPPVALDGDEHERPATEVVVVPSHYSTLGRIADHISKHGYEVLDVGSDEWESVASLLPYLRGADVVVCSGYSTIMDAAVAGTPCVVYPATNEQDAVADWLERFDVTGFTVAREPLDVLEAVESPPDTPSFENGADAIAETVIDDLSRERNDTTEDTHLTNTDRSTTAIDQLAPHIGSGQGAIDSPRTRISDAKQLAVDRLVAGTTAIGTTLQVLLLHSRAFALAAKRLVVNGIATARRYTIRAGRVVAVRVGSALMRLINTGRVTARRYRRYRTATLAMSIAAVIVVRSRLGRNVIKIGSGIRTGVMTLREMIESGLGKVSRGVDTLRNGMASATKRVTAFGERLTNTDQSLE